MDIEHIKANGIYYRPQEPNIQDPEKVKDCTLPPCKITKMLFGRYKIEYRDDSLYSGKEMYNNYFNTKIILYPSGIEEIVYTNRNKQ